MEGCQELCVEALVFAAEPILSNWRGVLTRKVLLETGSCERCADVAF